jgi:hypothetical protein
LCQGHGSHTRHGSPSSPSDQARELIRSRAVASLFPKKRGFRHPQAVRLALPAYAEAVACDGCPPLARLVEQYAEGGGSLLVCPICFSSRKLDQGELVAKGQLGGATSLWEWIGDDGATVLSY